MGLTKVRGHSRKLLSSSIYIACRTRLRCEVRVLWMLLEWPSCYMWIEGLLSKADNTQAGVRQYQIVTLRYVVFLLLMVVIGTSVQGL